jgi:hypothetical protein
MVIDKEELEKFKKSLIDNNFTVKGNVFCKKIDQITDENEIKDPNDYIFFFFNDDKISYRICDGGKVNYNKLDSGYITLETAINITALYIKTYERKLKLEKVISKIK